LNDLLQRHESLRTIFSDGEEGARQIVLDKATLSFEQIACDANELAQHLRTCAGYRFELTHELPVRAWLFALSHDEHVLLLQVHHIASDGWSWRPLFRDLGVAYAARREGRFPAWQPLPVQYVDYALRQREWLGSEGDKNSVIAAQIAYWQQHLAGLPEQLDLIVDFPRPASPSFRGADVSFQLDADMHARLLQLAHDSQASLFMLLHAAVAVTLSRLGAGTDIPLGTVIAGRTDEALDELVGFFVNTLVLRTDVSGRPSFRELLKRVRQNDLAAYAHQDLPFERLVEIVNPVRALNRHPLFQVMLSLQNNAGGRLELPGLTAAPQATGYSPAKFDLSFEFVEGRDAQGEKTLRGSLQYATDLYAPDTAQQMLQRLVQVLHSAVENPDQPIGGIGLLTAAEQQRLMHWQSTAHALSAALLPDLFEAQASATPAATALVCEDATLDYKQLNAKASRLAALLIADGIGPEDCIAVALPRSSDLLVAMLAIVKAGAAYLPLDMTYPAERLRFVLEDARPVAVLTTCDMSGRLPAHAARTVQLDDPACQERLASVDTHNPPPTQRVRALRGDHPAYVIYTSGSTGRPKGTVITHAGLTNQLQWFQDRYPCTAQDRLLARSALGFDAAVWETWLPLLNGATLYLLPDALTRDPHGMLAYAQQHGITLMQWVPSMLPA
ncbi:non-ribosomal peptide synthetase, partial [Dyella choica]|uniref:non-ribosomal peptide synthetase n=1 Tax=Dyella choica TaxID=1927959 RepID=UPI0018AD4271